MDSNRRSFLGGAVGAGGLVALTSAALALEKDHGNPGDGGFGRSATQLSPGATVAYHNPDDVAAMPNFQFSLDGNKPKVTTGGWAKEATVHQFPISKGIAGVHMFLDAGASRELHWHAIAAEWAFVIDGQCQTVVLTPEGTSEINNYRPGDLWFFPKGHGHSIQTIGDKPCHFILSFDNGAFSEHGTFSITDWINVTPKEMLALDFGLPKDLFEAFPKGETYIQSGPVIPVSAATDAPWPKESTHKFSLLHDPHAVREFDGGTFHLATVDEWPISKSMSGGRMVIKPGAMRNLHWNVNANEWHYYLRGKGPGRAVWIGRPRQGRGVQPGRRRLYSAGLRPRDQECRHRRPRDRPDLGQWQVRGDRPQRLGQGEPELSARQQFRRCARADVGEAQARLIPFTRHHDRRPHIGAGDEALGRQAFARRLQGQKTRLCLETAGEPGQRPIRPRGRDDTAP